FEVDILRNDVCDISMNLQLTERVLVSTDGSVSSVEAVPEPDEHRHLNRRADAQKQSGANGAAQGD
ncbi:phage tail protein, partial [Salmonella enterica subsp. enterica serovar Montevideo]|nr:phage tail protein [Salmonella enterica subsp. enterica serovar Montevideo]